MNTDLKTIKHYTLTWNCKCNERTDVSTKQAIIECRHMPADGSVWITNNTVYHNFFNGGEKERVHIVAGILGYNF